MVRAFALVLVLAAGAVLAGDPGDRLTGVAHCGGLAGRMDFELLAVEGEIVDARVTFSGGISGTGVLHGVVRRGELHMNGLLIAGTSHFDMALRAVEQRGGLAGVYELSEQETLARQVGDFTLAAVDARK